ncbi:MAG TPA: zf-HC2 domain-containing protein [Thermoanaerobaculia bacterium]
MNHADAIEKLAAERYLLNELSPQERDAFEEHYFDCPVCAEAVTNGVTLIESGRSVVREQSAAPAANVTRLRWTARLSTAAAAVLALFLGIQMLAPRTEQMAAPGSDRLAISVVEPHDLRLTRSEGDARILQPEGTPLQVQVEDPQGRFPRYMVELRRKDAPVSNRLELTKQQAQQATYVHLGQPPAGDYEVVILGVPEVGQPQEINRVSIVIQPR